MFRLFCAVDSGSHDVLPGPEYLPTSAFDISFFPTAEIVDYDDDRTFHVGRPHGSLRFQVPIYEMQDAKTNGLVTMLAGCGLVSSESASIIFSENTSARVTTREPTSLRVGDILRIGNTSHLIRSKNENSYDIFPAADASGNSTTPLVNFTPGGDGAVAFVLQKWSRGQRRIEYTLRGCKGSVSIDATPGQPLIASFVFEIGSISSTAVEGLDTGSSLSPILSTNCVSYLFGRSEEFTAFSVSIENKYENVSSLSSALDSSFFVRKKQTIQMTASTRLLDLWRAAFLNAAKSRMFFFAAGGWQSFAVGARLCQFDQFPQIRDDEHLLSWRVLSSGDSGVDFCIHFS